MDTIIFHIIIITCTGRFRSKNEDSGGPETPVDTAAGKGSRMLCPRLGDISEAEI